MSVISNLVERTVRSTSIRSPSALFATERGRDARTYAGETSAHPGGAWASETRAPGCHLCGRDVRAPRRRLGGRDPRTRLSLMRARRPRTQSAVHADDCALSNMGGTACRAPLIRHRNDDMWRPGGNAPYRSRSGITPIPGSSFPEEERLVRSRRIFYNLPFCEGSCDFTLFPQNPSERHQIKRVKQLCRNWSL